MPEDRKQKYGGDIILFIQDLGKELFQVHFGFGATWTAFCTLGRFVAE